MMDKIIGIYMRPPQFSQGSPDEIAGITYRPAKVGEPALCGFCGQGIDLGKTGQALVDGPIQFVWPIEKPACRSCVAARNPQAALIFEIVRKEEDAKERALLAAQEKGEGKE